MKTIKMSEDRTATNKEKRKSFSQDNHFWVFNYKMKKKKTTSGQNEKTSKRKEITVSGQTKRHQNEKTWHSVLVLVSGITCCVVNIWG